MPNLSNIVSRFTKDTLLYWEKVRSGPDGKPVFANPVPIKVRWEDRQQEIIMPDGRKVMSHAYVLSSTDMVEGSVVWLGTMAQYQAQPYYPARPTVNQGVREVIKVGRTPGLSQLPGNVYEVYL